MYAGKTSKLLQRILWDTHQNRQVLVVKPSLDDRYSDDHIETHNRLSFPCFAMNQWSDVFDRYDIDSIDLNTVFLDEIQFMDTADTVNAVNLFLERKIDVVAAGLDQDSRGQPFETTAMLLAMSDTVEKIQSICSVTGKPATKTQRMTDKDDRVAVGSIGMYEPRCLEHWSPK